MDFSTLTLILSICTLAIVVYIFLKLRDQKTIESGKSENLENKIDSVSKDLNDIENQLASVTTPINELNRFLGGNVTTGRLGEWSLESIIKEILPDGSQEGLTRVTLGNFLIKRVVYEIQEELPNIKNFGTLSPIPGFRDWFTTLDETIIQNILGKILLPIMQCFILPLKN